MYGRAEPVDGATDVEQHVRVVGGDELGPDDPGVRAVRLLDQRADDVGGEHDVVVADEQEGRALDSVQRLVGRLREAGASRAGGGRTRPADSSATRAVGST